MAQATTNSLSLCIPLVWAERDRMELAENPFTCFETFAQGCDNFLNLFSSKVAIAHSPHIEENENGKRVYRSAVDIKVNNESDPWWLTALKVIGYCTVVLPLFALLIRAIFRCGYEFNVENTEEETTVIDRLNLRERLAAGLDLNRPHNVRLPDGGTGTVTLRDGIEGIYNAIQQAEQEGRETLPLTKTLNPTIADHQHPISALLNAIDIKALYPGKNLRAEGTALSFILDLFVENRVIGRYDETHITSATGRRLEFFSVTLNRSQEL